MALDPRCDAMPFERLSVPYGDTGGRREVARYTCQACPSSIDIPIKTGMGLSVDAHKKWLGQKGWTLTGRGMGARCPACQSSPSTPEPPQETSDVSAALDQSPRRSAAAPVPLHRGPTADQRLAIRTALDTHFDDKDGMFLEGHSDQTIAESIGVPRAWVESIRETAYGPIRITPELLSLRKDLAAMTAEHAAHGQKIATLTAEHTALADTIRELQGRLAKVEGRAA